LSVPPEAVLSVTDDTKSIKLGAEGRRRPVPLGVRGTVKSGRFAAGAFQQAP